MKTAKKKNPTSPQMESIALSKREGAARISGGLRHLHSSTLGAEDPHAKVTAEALMDGTVPTYGWEKTRVKEYRIASSAERYDLIARLVGDNRLKTKRILREKLEMVLEELLTNSLYHAYRSGDGEEKYARREAVRLAAPKETLKVKYHASDEGIFMSIEDCGGSLKFDDIASALARCYGPQAAQIENKDSGAGLGLYMVFDAATHFKIVCTEGKSTTISVWLSDKKTFDPNTFSFNYFGGKAT